MAGWLRQLRIAGTRGRGQFGNPEEGERPPLKAATKQRLVNGTSRPVHTITFYNNKTK
jgi:hypothetical protein